MNKYIRIESQFLNYYKNSTFIKNEWDRKQGYILRNVISIKTFQFFDIINVF